MAAPLPTEVEVLQARLAGEPESEPMREALLFAWLEDPKRFGDPQRIEHICQFIERFPRSHVCRTPMVAVDARHSPADFHRVEALWTRLLQDNPGDIDLIVHAALFVANADRDRALAMLRPIVDADSGRAQVWFEMGRIARDPRQRLDCLTRAQTHGSTHPNLAVWIAHQQAAVGEFEAARVSARALLALVDEARARHGDVLDWRERGSALWERARAASTSTAAASVLVKAISAHAYHKHWGHTVAGLVAVHDGLLDDAALHLRASAEVRGDQRLGSYGPSMSLAAALCAAGRWDAVSAYLRACAAFWPDARLGRWKKMVDGRQAPDFPEQ